MGGIRDGLAKELELFGPKGIRARCCLETARWCLENGAAQGEIGRGVAACVRSAIELVLDIETSVEESGTWAEGVVEAKVRYVRAAEQGDADLAEMALGELLASIDLPRQGDRQSKWEAKAVGLIQRRRGDQPFVDALAPARRVVELYRRASELVHGLDSTSIAEVAGLLGEVEEWLWAVLCPMPARDPRLVVLADIEDPSDEDVRQAKALLVTPRDLGVFLDRVVTPAWLERLSEGADDLDPTGRRGRWWVAHKAVVRLSGDHRERMVAWVMQVSERCRGDVAGCRSIALALLDMDPPEIERALQAAAPHLEDWWFLHNVCDALKESSHPADDVVVGAADLILNALVADSTADLHLSGGRDNQYLALLEMLSDGATPENAALRIDLLAHKLTATGQQGRSGAIGEDEPMHLWVFPFQYSTSAPILSLAEIDADAVHSIDAVTALSSCLVRIVHKAAKWLRAADLLELLSEVPDPLGHRLRVWFLSEAYDADPEEMAATIEAAIPSRSPTCDDLALIDRITEGDGSGQRCASGYLERWKYALGEPPTLMEAGRAIGSDDPLPNCPWWYPYLWAGLVPEQASSQWEGSDAVDLLEAKIPPRSRSDLAEIAASPSKSGAVVWAGAVPSPLDGAVLRDMEPEAAAKEIAAWRPEPGDWAARAQVLASTLQGLVKADPAAWGANPARLVGMLHHPTYISRYLSAFASLPGEQLAKANIGGLIGVAILAREEPWPVQDLGGLGDPDSYHYDRDWGNTRRSAVDLIRQLVVTDTGLSGRDQEVWSLLQAEAMQPPPRTASAAEEAQVIDNMLNPRGDRHPDCDPRHQAINQLNTSALEVALLLALRNREPAEGVPLEAIGLIEWGLSQPGAEGAKCRSLIAPVVAPLTVAIPKWVEANKSLLFGEDAPERLGQLTVDEALRWGQPYIWLSTHFRDEIYDAAQRGISRSLHWVLFSMLNDIECYEPRTVHERLGEYVPDACGVLAGLLDYPSTGEDTWDDTADQFLGIVMEDERHTRAIGRLSISKTMAHDKWASLTLDALEKTGGEIEMADLVIHRIFENPPTPDSARILTHLIEVQCNPALARQADNEATWERMSIARKAPQWVETARAGERDDAYGHLQRVLIRHGLI